MQTTRTGGADAGVEVWGTTAVAALRVGLRSCLVFEALVDLTPILLLWSQEGPLADALFAPTRHASFEVSRLNSSNGRLQ